ncbi:MerR family transcriptional regulator [Pontibacillus salicampi]|uniref:MerR family transcriptional regulator n=1 Tax=Pontibacillus salicampi TaxID=1449801 RepID=A0ABV6LIC8_9BACI
MFKVKDVANLVGVSVRTLHHYDEIGLLTPDSITPAGYRVYTRSNLERLQQIMFFKEMGLTLGDIKNLLDSPEFDRLEALQMHEEMLLKKQSRLEQMLQTVRTSIQALERGEEMEENHMFNGFDKVEIEKHQKKYEEEVRQKYPKAIVDESNRRTASYDEEDWENIQQEINNIYVSIAKRMDYGPDDAEVQKHVARWRNVITTYFYDCTLEIFRGLADLYVTDERFTNNINTIKTGLAPFLSKAMIVYCSQQEQE